MTRKIMLDDLRSTWVIRRSNEQVIATDQHIEEEKAQQATGSCRALTIALHELSRLPAHDRDKPTLETFISLENIIKSRLEEAEEEKLNLTPASYEFESMEMLGAVEEFRKILEDVRKHLATLNRESQVTYGLLVSNVGWVRNDCPDCEEVEKLYNEYATSKRYAQVTMWSSESDDPIEERYHEGGL